MSRENTPVSATRLLQAVSGEKTSFSEFYPDTNQIIIRGITLKEDLVIDNMNCETNISFVNCDLWRRIEIRGGTYKGFSISGGQLRAPLIISGGTFNGGFYLKEVDALDKWEPDSPEIVYFRGGEFNQIRIYKGAFQSVEIGRIYVKGGVFISSGFISSFNSTLEPYIKKLHVHPKQIDILEVYDVPIEHLVFQGILENGFYHFGDVSLNQLEFNSFVNLGRVRFARVTLFTVEQLKRGEPESTVDPVTGQRVIELDPGDQVIREPTLSMAHSILGQTRFSEMDLTKFASVKITDTTLTEIEISDTKWFLPGQLEHQTDGVKRDMYRQLKHAMIRQGNRIDELVFQAHEMNAYRRTLSLRNDFGDLLILLIGKYTNNFGTNYLLPAIWIVAVSALVLAVSLWSLGLVFADHWAGIFVVMNPTHNIDYLVPKDKISNTFVAVDSIGRVLIATLIYQLIIPFRKFASR